MLQSFSLQQTPWVTYLRNPVQDIWSCSPNCKKHAEQIQSGLMIDIYNKVYHILEKISTYNSIRISTIQHSIMGNKINTHRGELDGCAEKD